MLNRTSWKKPRESRRAEATGVLVAKWYRGAPRWAKRVLAGLTTFALILAAIPTSVEVASWFVPLPAAFTSEGEPAQPTRVTDRGGILLAEVRVDGKQSLPVRFEELPKHVVDALLAAEDKRFFEHEGVDWWAVGRALVQWAYAGRVVSGASTLTQQLARSTFEREKTVFGKWREMVLARRIERALTKRDILEAYVNRIDFGPNRRGLGAAAAAYFAKPVGGLSLSEAATLVGIPRGPTLYDPKRSQSPVRRRRDRILERLADNDAHYAEQVQRALAMPLELQEGWVVPGSFHWVRRQVNEASGRARPSEIRTTLDSSLQRRVEALVWRHAETMRRFGASSAAVLVADNLTHQVLAYVGSPDYTSKDIGGQNDGVVARRQPGSSLKPFVYAAAMERLGYTAATLLPDIPLEFREGGKVYSPRNYDGQFKGPVRLREALANSLNVPAVHTASRLGVGRLLGALHQFGFRSLNQPPEHYGVALALGDGEVTLEELVAGYMALANEGRYAPLRFREADRWELAPPLEGSEPVTASVSVISPAIAAVITRILEDPLARASAFGRHGVLEFDFPVAVKTGTSKGARDNWTLGFSSAVTVGVWVGNFDGTPMTGASGVSGAGPLFHAVMREATSWVNQRAPSLRKPKATAILTKTKICALSGKLPTAACPTSLDEWFVPGTEPSERDDMHVVVPVSNGAFAPRCPSATPQSLEWYPPQFEAWAREAGRPVVPSRVLVDCGQSAEEVDERPEVTFPVDGAEYRWVADEPSARQQLVLRGTSGAGPLTFLIDGKRYRTTQAPHEVEWPLTAGDHTVQVVTAGGKRSELVHFRVR